MGDGDSGGREKKGRRKKETTSTSFLSRLSGTYRVYPLARARARERRPGNLIPFSIYLNPFTQTPLPTSSTFGLFLPFSAYLPSAAVTSPPSPPPLLLQPLFVLLHGGGGFLPSEFVERKEAHVSATSCLLYECCIANLRESPRVKREREGEKEGIGGTDSREPLGFNCLLCREMPLRGSHISSVHLNWSFTRPRISRSSRAARDVAR